eukprot:SAG22_NODE_2086_length_3031_cov_4.223056_3_plen_219_part_00
MAATAAAAAAARRAGRAAPFAAAGRRSIASGLNGAAGSASTPLHAPRPQCASFSSASASGAAASLRAVRQQQQPEVAKLAEVRQREAFRGELLQSDCARHVLQSPAPLLGGSLGADGVKLALEAGLTTFLLHCESRVASACGHGFYTIGPCGEELLAGAALALRPDDAVALHYRHLGTSVARALQAGRPLEQVVLDRARGYTVSASDPVTGGGSSLAG